MWWDVGRGMHGKFGGAATALLTLVNSARMDAFDWSARRFRRFEDRGQNSRHSLAPPWRASTDDTPSGGCDRQLMTNSSFS